MVKAADLRDLDDCAMLHDLPLNQTLLFQREMRTRSVVIEPCGPKAAGISDEEEMGRR